MSDDTPKGLAAVWARVDALGPRLGTVAWVLLGLSVAAWFLPYDKHVYAWFEGVPGGVAGVSLVGVLGLVIVARSLAPLFQQDGGWHGDA